MESLDFSSDEVFPHFGCIFLEMKLDSGLDEVENLGDTCFFFQFAHSRMHEMTILGFDFPGNRLPDIGPLSWALEEKNPELRHSAVNNDLNLSYDGVGHD